jgi:predicted nucleic acid-binding protein
MIVVSDTSPLTALLTVGEAEILLKLFAEVIIPEAVQNELLRSHPHLPTWLRVERVKDPGRASQYSQTVDAGEAAAIELAKELNADRLLIDERKGRRLAIQEGIAVIGLLGVVLLAKRRQLVPSARALLQRLEREAGMYLSEDIREAALRSVGEIDKT